MSLRHHRHEAGERLHIWRRTLDATHPQVRVLPVIGSAPANSYYRLCLITSRRKPVNDDLGTRFVAGLTRLGERHRVRRVDLPWVAYCAREQRANEKISSV